MPSINTPTIRRLLRVDAGLSLANSPQPLRIGRLLRAAYDINPSPWNGTQTAVAYNVCVYAPRSTH